MDSKTQIDNQLYEWSLKNILLVAGAGLAALIGKGVKLAINSAAVKANKSKLDQRLSEFKERMEVEINQRVAKYKKDLEDDENPKLSKEKKRAYQKALLDYVKKEISAAGKRMDLQIDKSSAGKEGKESLKVYWETITTSVELDLLEQLHKLDIIGEEDRDALSDKASENLEKIINIFLKKFGVNPDQEPKPSEAEQLRNTYKEIEDGYKGRNKKTIEELEKLIEKSKLWRDFYDNMENKLSDKEKEDLKTPLKNIPLIKQELTELQNDLVLDKRQKDNEKILFDYLETLFKNRAKYIKQTFDSGTYQEYADTNKMKDFVRYMVGEIMDNPDQYDKQAKILQNKTISDKQLLVLFFKVFMKGFEEQKDEQSNEGFLSLYDYIEKHL